jgi:hypothetical protein
MSLNPVSLETNLKKSENTIKPFRIYLDYQQPKVLVVKDDSTKEEETEEVVLDNEIKKDSLDNKEDIKMKKVGV